MQAVTSEEGEGAWSATGEGTANRPPAASSVSFSGGTLGVGGSFAWHEAPPLGSGAFFSDPDSDALTYSAAAQHPALLGVSLTGAAGNAVLTANLLNQGSSKVTCTARDAYGGSVTRTATIGISAKVSRSIAEGSAAGTSVGAPVTGTPYNGAALTYSLTGNAASSGLFAIDSGTGQIKVATGATLDYDTDDTHREIEYLNGEVVAKFYRGKVQYTVSGHAAAIDVSIVVTDNVAPVITDPGDKTYAQGEAIPAFDVTVTDADGTPTVTVTGLPSGLSYGSGQVSGTVAQDAAVQDHTVTISADDGVNDAVSETFTVTVTDSSFAPVIVDPGDKTYAQGASITAFDITVTDADGDTPTVTVTGLPSGLSYASGQVSGTVAADATLQDYTVTISADDGSNAAVTETFTITVTDVSFAPVVTDPGDKSYAQGASITAFDITVTDADGDTPTVTVTGLPSGLSYASGQVSGTVAQDAAVQDHTVTISADDGSNAAVTETFTITVTDVSFSPVIADPGDKTYAQGASITAFDITVTDADGDTPTVTVTGLPSGLSYASGQVSGTVAQDAAVQDHTVTISADDGSNAAVTETFTITVTDVSFSPVIADPGDKTYAQGASITAFDITVTDADGDTPTVTVTGLPSGLSYASGQVSGTVAADATLQDYTVTISADDGSNAAVTETFTITVTDVSFAPVVTDPGDKSYAQGASITAFDITVTDADGDTPTVTVTGLPSGLSYASGQVSGTVAQDAAVQDHTVRISADDGSNAAVTETFTITVTDVSFAPVVTDPGDKSYTQGASITAFDITVTDADGDTPTVTVTGLPSGLSYGSGQVSGTVAQDAAVQDHTVTISADDGSNAAVTETFTVTVTDVSWSPRFTSPGSPGSPGTPPTTSRSVAENTAAGGEVGAAVTATDADNDDLSYSLAGTDATRFAIDATSGQITVGAGTVLDYETTQSYSVTVGASDGNGGTGSIGVTISVTDVDEPPAAPGAPSVTRSSTSPRSALEVSWTAPANAGRPAIDDYNVQYREQGATAWTAHAFTGTGTSTTLTGLTEDTIYEVQVQAGNDEGDGPWSDSGTGSPGNEAPVFEDPDNRGTPLATTSRSVAENTAAGGEVGAAVTATDADNDDLSYSLAGTDATRFAIDATSGQITVAAGTVLDYEATRSYSVTVEASDGNGGTGSIGVTISVTDVDEPPAEARGAVGDAGVHQFLGVALEVSWTAPANAGRPAIDDYNVQYPQSRARRRGRPTPSPARGCPPRSRV